MPDVSPASLPDFTNPPLTEVAISVAFEPLPKYTSAHAGQYWLLVNTHFKLVEEHPPLLFVTEKEGVQPQPAPEPKILSVMKPRIWLLSEDQTELLQIQSDGFARNWRQRSGTEMYPRFGPLRDRFAEEFQRFTDFVERSALGEIVVRQCEVTYVNHVMAGADWSSFGEMYKVISGCADLSGAQFLSPPEEVSYSAKFAMRDEDGRFLGRLSMSAQPAFRKHDKKPLIAFSLTARGRPVADGVEGVVRFLDLAHVWIVRGFADVTTPAVHRSWGRTR